MPHDTITLEDTASGARARIAPAIGFNCFSFEVPAGQGERLETLWAADDFIDGKARPSSSGIPLLFPFAGRIRGTSFRFENKSYELTAGDGRGNAIHGFVIDRPWRVTRREANRAVGQFQASVDDPKLVEHWPADFRITADYQVAGRSLIAEYTIENPDKRPLPFGFGTHPYFHVPLGSTDAADCVVTVAVTDDWQLQNLLPTGSKTPTPLTTALSRGAPFGELKLDHVFSGLRFENHRTTASIHDPRSKRTLAMSFDDRFAACVVYTPPHRQAICIEPYTTVPDPFSLLERQIDPHLQTLAPGARFSTRVEISLS
jgi:aldose 1-epimerase